MNKVRVALGVFAVSTSLWGQVSANVSGSVVDPTGAAIPGASVVLRLPGSETALYSTSTASDGHYALQSVSPGTYDLFIDKTGFQKLKLAALKVDAARETALPPTKLEVASVSASVEVTEAVQAVQIASAEVSNTIRTQQIQNLPMIDRNPAAFIVTQTGVNSGRGNTTINGMRTSFNNMTLDGVNIQDNFLRGNDLDFVPNRLLVDGVAEVTITTSNGNNALSGGAGQVNFVTPSGGNQYHGGLIYTNRNSAAAANSWFNNQRGIPLSRLNINHAGGNVGGPIKKDKLFFYTNYELQRQRAQQTENRTILTADARQGIFTYRDTTGNIRKVNVLTTAGVTLDPTMKTLLDRVPGADKINNTDVGDSTPGFLRNTAGYAFAMRNNNDRDTGLLKLDYIPSVKHAFSVTSNTNRDSIDRPDQTNEYTVIPSVLNDETTKLLSALWRWNPSARMTNELRWGFNWAPGTFANSTQYDKFILDGAAFSSPVNRTTRSQGRNTDTYNLSDNASYTRGRHTIQYGFQMQRTAVEYYDEAGITPTYTVGIGTGNKGLTAADLPGISAADLNGTTSSGVTGGANSLLATLAGYVSNYSQRFNVSSRTSGFVPGQQQLRHEALNNYGFFGQDRWKATPRLTLTLGLRWDYYAPVDERDGLSLLPKLIDNNPITSLLTPTNTLEFGGAAAGRPWYKKDLNNFAPTFGFAWDVFGNGKTAVRGGYSIAFVNDAFIVALDNSGVATNSGLQSLATKPGLTGRVSTSLPAVPTPVFKVPRMFAENYALDPMSAYALIDPNLVTPYVQQYSFGIQHEVKHNVFEVRYVGNHATKQLRAFDFNQVIIKENGFLADFQRAQNNGLLAQRATGTFNPAYNANIPGSQVLPVFNQLAQGGLLTNSTIIGTIQQGAVGELGNLYQTNGLNGNVNFFRNFNGLGNNLMTNYSNATYNGLQAEFTRRLASLFFTSNYVFSKVMSDASGTNQANFEPFLDINNSKIERSRVAAFDITHQFKALGNWELPFGTGKKYTLGRGMNRLVGGWAIGGILNLQSGSPFSVLSGRGTLNRAGRSTNTNTSNTSIDKSQLDSLFQFRMTGNGPYFVAANAIGPDGRGVAADGVAPFSGQVFSQPVAGTVGGLQRNYFSGPWINGLNLNVTKVTKITERQSIELRVEAVNVFNHPTFTLGDQTLTSTTFGKITGFNTTETVFSARRLQFGLHYRF